MAGVFSCACWGSVTAATKEEAEEKAVRKALDEGDDPEWVMQRIVESFNAFHDYSPDDLPKGMWVFRLQSERFADGTCTQYAAVSQVFDGIRLAHP